MEEQTCSCPDLCFEVLCCMVLLGVCHCSARAQPLIAQIFPFSARPARY